MCAFLNEIEQIVSDKTQNAELFTAFDVTKAVRQQVGRSTNVSHNEVKQEVHNLFANGRMGSDYVRTLGNMPLPTGIPQPFVYHRNTDDPANYGQGVPQLSGAAVTPSMAQAVLTMKSDPDDSDDGVNKTTIGTYKVDGRETLCVPKSLLTAAGLNPGDEVYVSTDALAGCIVVSKSVPDGSVLSQLSTYTVDCYGNVRIVQSTLQRGGVAGQEFDITGDASKVYIRKH